MGNEVTERQQAGVASTEDPVDGEDGLAVADLGVLELAVVGVDDTSRDGVESSAGGGVVAVTTKSPASGTSKSTTPPAVSQT